MIWCQFLLSMAQSICLKTAMALRNFGKNSNPNNHRKSAKGYYYKSKSEIHDKKGGRNCTYRQQRQKLILKSDTSPFYEKFNSESDEEYKLYGIDHMHIEE